MVINAKKIAKRLDNSMVYKEPIILPVAGGQSRVRAIAIPKVDSDNQIKIYPNPAINYCIVNYCWENETSVGLLELYDATGKKIYTTNLSGQKGDLLIDTKELKSGLYYSRIIVDGKILKTEAINIAK